MGAKLEVGTNKAILKVKRKKNVYEVMSARAKSWKSSRTLITSEHYDMVPTSTPTYVNIDTPPSMLPPKKYCDITGLPAKYMDPVTKIRYASKEVFRMVRKMQEHKVEEFLSLRHAQTRIK